MHAQLQRRSPKKVNEKKPVLHCEAAVLLCSDNVGLTRVSKIRELLDYCIGIAVFATVFHKVNQIFSDDSLPVLGGDRILEGPKCHRGLAGIVSIAQASVVFRPLKIRRRLADT